MNDKSLPMTREEQENEFKIRLGKINELLEAKIERFLIAIDNVGDGGSYTVDEIENERSIDRARDISIMENFEYIQNNFVGTFPETEKQRGIRENLANTKIKIEQLANVSNQVFDELLEESSSD